MRAAVVAVAEASVVVAEPAVVVAARAVAGIAAVPLLLLNTTRARTHSDPCALSQCHSASSVTPSLSAVTKCYRMRKD